MPGRISRINDDRRSIGISAMIFRMFLAGKHPKIVLIYTKWSKVITVIGFHMFMGIFTALLKAIPTETTSNTYISQQNYRS
jgi:hypothetical protein